MSWFKLKAQPKDERPPLQGYGDQLEGYSGKEMDPPQGGSVIARYRSPVVPAPPHPRVDPDLIGDYYL